MNDAKALKDHTEQIIAMIRHSEENADRFTKEALENEAEYVKQVSNQYMDEMDDTDPLLS